MGIIEWVLANWQNALIAIEALLGGLIAVSLIIPGEQPDKTFQAMADFIKMISRK